MDKTSYYVITVSRYDSVRGDVYFSYVFKVRNNENLWPLMLSLQNSVTVISLNACDTKRYALELAKRWNQTWEERGTLWNEEQKILYKAIWC